MLVDRSSLSRISVNSKKNTYKSKISPSPSTSMPETPQLLPAYSNDFLSCEEYWITECPDRQLKTLQKTVAEMEKNQLQVEQKFQKCIAQMLSEIERNNDSNGQLAVEVNKLKTDVKQSKKDILVIEDYLNASQKKEAKRKMVTESGCLTRLSSSRDLLGSMSRSKNILSRRNPSRLFKSKLFSKQ